ncbi:hypothetical protein M404DRAFT_995751 [Pisolithus tinctorius Marx 270]|uniref:Uncharacterized protein n=1 Tax=Pisolithus tinctorius Marx 270 TaxID=870435 RepID=A0A0C3PPX6_PISTI|nr:hypothetical protein M404DRAFT_995751 [Pisolithus tinctorius Marx 270]
MAICKCPLTHRERACQTWPSGLVLVCKGDFIYDCSNTTRLFTSIALSTDKKTSLLCPGPQNSEFFLEFVAFTSLIATSLSLPRLTLY